MSAKGLGCILLQVSTVLGAGAVLRGSSKQQHTLSTGRPGEHCQEHFKIGLSAIEEP